MAWTTPRTWVAAEVPTAAILNTHIRDNLAATEAGVATTAGDLVYASAANTLARLAKGTSGMFLRVAGGLPAWATSGSSLSVSRVTLTDVATSAVTTWTDWGTEYCSVADPGTASVDIVCWLNGNYNTNAATSTQRLRIAVSIDGGSTWSYSPTVRQYLLSTYWIGAFAVYGLTAQDPTGQIRAKAQYYADSSSCRFYCGALALLVVP